ncbi:cupin domain-containing protein [Planctomycetota bacterium]
MSSLIIVKAGSGQDGSKIKGCSNMSGSNECAVQAIRFKDDGTFPNNQDLPLIIYDQVFPPEDDGLVPLERIWTVIEAHHWGNAWTNGIYTYHHYHSTAHEVLIVCQGDVTVQFGGPQGEQQMLQTGDAVVIPAGVAHKKVQAAHNFSIVGAYPQGQIYDMCYGKSDERPKADRNIKAVPIPAEDPIYGLQGPLSRYWKIRQP